MQNMSDTENRKKELSEELISVEDNYQTNNKIKNRLNKK